MIIQTPFDPETVDAPPNAEIECYGDTGGRSDVCFCIGKCANKIKALCRYQIFDGIGLDCL